jgi:hypothetical protein
MELVANLPITNARLSADEELQAFKISINQDGIYRLTYEDLVAAGLNDQIPINSQFHMTSQGEDVAILINDGSDNSFGSGDFIEFYGQKLNGEHLAELHASENTHWMTYSQQTTEGSFVDWKPQFDKTMVEYYSDENVYWLNFGDIEGLQMAGISGDPAGSTAITPGYYWKTEHVEESNTFWPYHFTSTDTWFWERATEEKEYVYSTTLSSLASVPISATVRGEVVADSNNYGGSPDHYVDFQINSSTVFTLENWDGRSRYHYEFDVPMGELNEGENQLKMKVYIESKELLFERIYFDWFEVKYARQFEAQNDTINISTHDEGERKYVVNGFSSPKVEVFDISNPLVPIQILQPEISGANGDYTTTFSVTQSIGDDFILVGDKGILEPLSITLYNQASLKSTTLGADYIIVTHRDFITAAQDLADYRASQGLRTLVVNVDELYNQFFYGIRHPLAVKNFLSYATDNWIPPAPKYVILVGDGHWNPKGFSPEIYGSDEVFMLPNLNWVGPWMGMVDSTNLLATLADSDPLPDLHISRIPVNTNDEMVAVVEKIKAYETTSPYQDWTNRVTFIADDPDPSIIPDFEFSSDLIIGNYIPSGVEVERIYLEDYCGGATSSASQCPEMTTAIENSLNITGTLIINYTGHGAINRWAHEQVWSNDNIAALANGGKLPFILSMTCLDGTWIWPDGPETNYGQGLIEEMIRADAKGAVGAFSPSGLGLATGHDAMAEGFYNALYSDDIHELGELALAAKTSLYETNQNLDLIQTFTIFGDPAMKLAVQSPPIYLPLVVNTLD